MLFKPYCLTDAVTRTVSTDEDGTNRVTFSGNTTSGNPFSITTFLEDAQRWINGELIQVAFPYLTADDREILKTGIDAEEWDRLFG